MRNVWLVFRRDVPNLFRNVMSVIITVGLVVLPSLFAWYNILACWDVFNNTGNLSVAVASEDEGFESDLVPVNINIGDKVVDALRANDEIGWVITEPEDAIEGVKSGKYYAALVVPADFSKQLLTFYEGDSASASINYYVNEKKNAISPNITGTGADTVSYQVNQAFAEAVSQIATGLVQSLAQHADEDGIDERVAIIPEHMRSLADRIDQASSVLGLYSSLGQDSQELLQGTASLIDSVSTQADSAVAAIENDKAALSGLIAKLESALGEITAPLDEMETSFADIEEKVDTLINNGSGDAGAAASALRSAASDFNSQANALSERKAALESIRDELNAIADSATERAQEAGSVSIALKAEINAALNGVVALDKAIGALSAAIDALNEASSSCNDAADSLETGSSDIQQSVQSLHDQIAQAKADLASARSEIDASLTPGIEKLKADIQTLSADLDAAASNLGGLGSGLSQTVSSAGQTLGDGSVKLDAARGKMADASQGMRNLAESIETALVSGDAETLKSLLDENASDVAASLSAPVQVNRTALFPSDGFGSAMTPLYCALAIFIGSLLIMVAMKPEVSARGREELVNPKPRHLYFGRFGVVSVISLAQTTLLGLGCLLFLKVQVSDPLLFMIAFWVAGLVFAFIIYTLVVSFGNLGKAIAVLLLIVQVTACGGSYPLQILPDFVQAVSPWVPTTYFVNALRAAMFGVVQNDFWLSIGKLALFFIPFLLLGLVLRKPLERFMKFYVSKVEECKVME